MVFIIAAEPTRVQDKFEAFTAEAITLQLKMLKSHLVILKKFQEEIFGNRYTKCGYACSALTPFS